MPLLGLAFVSLTLWFNYSFILLFIDIRSSTNPSIHPFILSSIYPSIHLFINQFIHPSNHSSSYSSIYPFHPSFYSSIHSFIYPFIHPSTQLSIYSFIYSSIHSSSILIHPSIHPSIHSKPEIRSKLKMLILSSSSKSCDLDPIPTNVLKNCLYRIITPITDIINISLETSTFPQNFKEAHV